MALLVPMVKRGWMVGEIEREAEGLRDEREASKHRVRDSLLWARAARRAADARASLRVPPPSPPQALPADTGVSEITRSLRLGPVGSTGYIYYCVLDIRDHEGERVTRRCRVTRSPSGREVGW